MSINTEINGLSFSFDSVKDAIEFAKEFGTKKVDASWVSVEKRPYTKRSKKQKRYTATEVLELTEVVKQWGNQTIPTSVYKKLSKRLNRPKLALMNKIYEIRNNKGIKVIARKW